MAVYTVLFTPSSMNCKVQKNVAFSCGLVPARTHSVFCSKATTTVVPQNIPGNPIRTTTGPPQMIQTSTLMSISLFIPEHLIQKIKRFWHSSNSRDSHYCISRSAYLCSTMCLNPVHNCLPTAVTRLMTMFIVDCLESV